MSLSASTGVGGTLTPEHTVITHESGNTLVSRQKRCITPTVPGAVNDVDVFPVMTYIECEVEASTLPNGVITYYQIFYKPELLDVDLCKQVQINATIVFNLETLVSVTYIHLHWYHHQCLTFCYTPT